MPPRGRLVVAALLATTLGACSSGGSTADPPPPTASAPAPLDVRGLATGGGGPARFLAAALAPFDACSDLLEHLKDEADERVTPWGLGGGAMFVDSRTAMEDASGGDSSAGAPAAPTTAAAGAGTSGTNVQVAGVDEPDMVKVDGSRMVVLVQGQLRVLDVSGAEPVEVGSLDLGDLGAESLFLVGSRAWVLGSGGGASPAADAARLAGPAASSGTVVVEVDLSDPTAPREQARLTADGWRVAARLVDGSLRLVVRAEQPNGVDWVTPSGSGLRAERRAREANRALIAETDVADWLPWAVVERRDGDRVTTSEGTLVDCDSVARPEDFAGFGTLSVVTIDADAPLAVQDAVAVLSAGQTVYASTERLYVATADWTGERPAGTTDLHAFDLTDPASTTYIASGSVEGTVLDQFSLDEHAGVLRVASTRGGGWGRGSSGSDSVVTTLAVQGNDLVQRGRVEGLGPGEAIQSVRFLGDVGYVVTFRQTDPLYTLDLSDPAAPRTVGELKINGWSAYLHPLEDGFLMGVGQDATDEGRALGTQVSVFDVRDPANPVRVAQHGVPDSASEVDGDHHAFLHWAPTGLTVVPVTTYDGTSHALVLRAAGGRLDQLGELRHPADEDRPYGATMRRAVVSGEVLLTISEAGILASSTTDLAQRGWLAWA